MRAEVAVTRILVVDNYDSFVWNLVHYLAELGADPLVLRADRLPARPADVRADGVLVSPGPGRPERAWGSVGIVRAAAAERVPLLGVCLGHQALAAAFGARVERAPELLHGKTSVIDHDGTGLFDGLPAPLTATRYHSLAVVESSLPAELAVSARSRSGLVMGLTHCELPLAGVQFHPESVLTEGGHRLLANWLSACGLTSAPAAAVRLGTEFRPRQSGFG